MLNPWQNMSKEKLYILESNRNVRQQLNRDTATTQCNTLQHTVTRCNTLQQLNRGTATHCNTLHTLQHAATHCNTLQHAATRCNTLNRTTWTYTAKSFFLQPVAHAHSPHTLQSPPSPLHEFVWRFWRESVQESRHDRDATCVVCKRKGWT